jgi:ECF sigma factor
VRFADSFDQVIARLSDPTRPDPTLNPIAIRKRKGDTGAEIGAFLGTSTRTIDRKLRLIRAIWKEPAG